MSSLVLRVAILRAARHSAALRAPAITVAIALGLWACKGLTEVDADVVQPGDYASAAGATAIAGGAITRFHLAFGGFPVATSQVGQSGLMADELLITRTGSPGSFGDRRDSPDPSSDNDPYTKLHDTRQRLLSAIGSFQQVAPDSSARIGQLFALLGYSSVFFGENFCAGVPLSHRDAALRPVYGQPLTTAQLFDSALTAFDSALVYGADSARITDLARVGRGRVLLNQGRFSEAAQAVASVPTTYIYQVTYRGVSTFEGGFNGFFGPTLGSTTDVTIPDQEGTNGINWRTATGTSPDPRTPLTDQNRVVGGVSVWSYTPYQAANAPIRLAGGIEARLIEAEAALQAGDATTWLQIHNTLRATAITPAMAALADPGTAASRVDLHFRERAFWLFLTGHRHGDLRRLVRQYGRPIEGVFPTGLWRDGLTYGTAVNLSPPSGQLGNPHYSGCLNRDA